MAGGKGAIDDVGPQFESWAQGLTWTLGGCSALLMKS